MSEQKNNPPENSFGATFDAMATRVGVAMDNAIAYLGDKLDQLFAGLRGMQASGRSLIGMPNLAISGGLKQPTSFSPSSLEKPPTQRGAYLAEQVIEKKLELANAIRAGITRVHGAGQAYDPHDASFNGDLVTPNASPAPAPLQQLQSSPPGEQKPPISMEEYVRQHKAARAATASQKIA